MGMSTTAIPFYSDDIKIGSVEEASCMALFGFEGKSIGKAIAKFGPFSRLDESDTGLYILFMGKTPAKASYGGDFVSWNKG